tara:strand:- start:243 stop:605 length:363 start_codon:yes stop_codon:yes gene_type:complete
MASYSFGYLNFALVSGSHYSPSDPNPNIIPPAVLGGFGGSTNVGPRTFPKVISFIPQGATTTITESLTIEYFQRVWDIDNSQWCYYTKTSIDTTPGTSETTPTNSGNITSASVIQILEIY